MAIEMNWTCFRTSFSERDIPSIYIFGGIISLVVFFFKLTYVSGVFSTPQAVIAAFILGISLLAGAKYRLIYYTLNKSKGYLYAIDPSWNGVLILGIAFPSILYLIFFESSNFLQYLDFIAYSIILFYFFVKLACFFKGCCRKRNKVPYKWLDSFLERVSLQLTESLFAFILWIGLEIISNCILHGIAFFVLITFHLTCRSLCYWLRRPVKFLNNNAI